MEEVKRSFNDGKVSMYVSCPYCGAKLYVWVKVTQYANPIVVTCQDDDIVTCGRAFGILPTFDVSIETFRIEPVNEKVYV